jgi:hypothetical protein
MVILSDSEARDLVATILVPAHDRPTQRRRRMTNTPTRPVDSEGDTRRALKLAANASQRATITQGTRDNAIRFAADSGASLREIAAATGLDHMTVKRIVDRQRQSK